MCDVGPLAEVALEGRGLTGVCGLAGASGVCVVELAEERLDLFVLCDVADALATTVACIDVCALAYGGFDHAGIFAADGLVEEGGTVGAVCVEVDDRVAREVEEGVDCLLCCLGVLLVGGEEIDVFDVELCTADLDELSDFGSFGDLESVPVVVVALRVVVMRAFEEKLYDVVARTEAAAMWRAVLPCCDSVALMSMVL